MRALLFTCNVPKNFGGNALLTTTHLINRLPSRVLSYSSPLAKLRETHPTTHLDNHLPLRVFGCSVFVHLHQPQSKLAPRAVKCVFLEYSTSQKGYKYYDPSSKHLFVSRDVTFSEHEPFFTKSSIQGESWSEFQSLDHVPESVPEPIPPHTSESIQSETITLPKPGGDKTKTNNKFGRIYSRRNKEIVDPVIAEVVLDSELVVYLNLWGSRITKR